MTSPDVPGGDRPAGHAPVPQRAFRRPFRKPASLALRNWPVSRRLFAVIILAVVMGLVFGGLRVASAVQSAAAFGRTTQLALLGEQVTALAQALETERDVTAALCAASPGAVCPAPGEKLDTVARSLQAQVRGAQTATTGVAGRVQTMAAQIDGAFPATTQTRAAQAAAMIDHLSGVRTAVQAQPPQSVVEAYSEAIADLFALNDEITSGSNDAILFDEVRTLGFLSRAKDEASQERASMYSALLQGSPGSALQPMATAQGLEDADLTAFQASATPTEENAYLSTVNGGKVDATELPTSFLTAASSPGVSAAQALSAALSNVGLGHVVVTPATEPQLWYSTMTGAITAMRSVEQQVAREIVARSRLLQHGARQSAILAAAAGGGVLLLVLIAALLVARSLVDPLRRLQASALEVASVRLPARVAELSRATDPDDVSLQVEPIGVDSTDEIGRVARAFDQVHEEAVRLAGNEAMLRGSFSAMFISLSRRSVPLIDRLARMIDTLEQDEADPGRLSSLFAMDHLVTRMRRNSENLLVLAGEEPVRKWTEPVPLRDVARAAASEIDQYERVALDIQPGIVVSGQAAADIVHLLAELIENATMFSPKDTSVVVSGQEVSTGGVLVEVKDSGIGISPARLAEMNWRFDNPPVVDVSVSRHMGLFAVSRLAARHGVRARVRAAEPQGTCALVWLPGTITGRESRRYAAAHRSRQPAGESLSWLGIGARRLAARPGLSPPVTAAEPDRPAEESAPAAREEEAAAAREEEAAAAAAAAAVTAAAAAAPAPAAGRSDWFRAKRPSGNGAHAASQDDGWGAPVQDSQDDGWGAPAVGSQHTGGWRIAETLEPAAAGDTSAAGLPTRVPGANLTARAGGGWSPADGGARGTAAGERTFGRPADGLETELLTPARRTPRERSPERARSRLSGFQLGSRDAAASTLSAGEEASP